VWQEDENLLALLTDDIVNSALLPRLSSKALIIERGGYLYWLNSKESPLSSYCL
jgi:hypothetical protein